MNSMITQCESDITIVGGGIAGLWAAKELIDHGLSIAMIEKSDTLADGSTTRNEGWLHAGTYHSVAIENNNEIVPVTDAIQASHDAIMDFAPESIDHGTTYAITIDDDLAHRAVERWGQTGVPYKAVIKNTIRDNNIIDVDRLSAIFQVKDKSVNSRALCQKLAQYIVDRGARIFTGAEFIAEDDTNARATFQGQDDITLRSARYLITAGAGIKDVYRQVTGNELLSRVFKAHLLVSPRLTTDNFFHLDAGESGLMNHGMATMVAINRDGIELDSPDYTIVAEKEALLYRSFERMIPRARELMPGRPPLSTVVCHKPDILTGNATTDVQSLDIKLLQPNPNYLFALPGKMTMAPYLAIKLMDVLLDGSGLVSTPALDTTGCLNHLEAPSVTNRPSDDWVKKSF